MLYFHLMGEREDRKKKKGERNHCAGGGFPHGWTQLAGCAKGHSLQVLGAVKS
jgi:hypothetical protein